jgi:hypothetical protein
MSLMCPPISERDAAAGVEWLWQSLVPSQFPAALPRRHAPLNPKGSGARFSPGSCDAALRNEPLLKSSEVVPSANTPAGKQAPAGMRVIFEHGTSLLSACEPGLREIMGGCGENFKQLRLRLVPGARWLCPRSSKGPPLPHLRLL